MTTIVSVRRGNQVVLGGDGQVSLGNTLIFFFQAEDGIRDF